MGGKTTQTPEYIMAEPIVGVDWNSRLFRRLFYFKDAHSLAAQAQRQTHEDYL